MSHLFGKMTGDTSPTEPPITARHVPYYHTKASGPTIFICWEMSIMPASIGPLSRPPHTPPSSYTHLKLQVLWDPRVMAGSFDKTDTVRTTSMLMVHPRCAPTVAPRDHSHLELVSILCELVLQPYHRMCYMESVTCPLLSFNCAITPGTWIHAHYYVQLRHCSRHPVLMWNLHYCDTLTHYSKLHSYEGCYIYIDIKLNMAAI